MVLSIVEGYTKEETWATKDSSIHCAVKIICGIIIIINYTQPKQLHRNPCILIGQKKPVITSSTAAHPRLSQVQL
jgi:hypothetical protein